MPRSRTAGPTSRRASPPPPGPGDAEFADARADFDRALAMNPDAQALYVGLVNRGALRVRQGLWEDAIKDLTRAVQLDRKAYLASINLSRAHQGAGHGDQALDVLDQAIRREP